MNALVAWLLIFRLSEISCRVYQTADSIIVEVDDADSHLVERSADPIPDRWCRTREGKTGSCMSFRDCYPFTSQPDFNELHTWVTATRSTCHYADQSGNQVYGICCYKDNNETDIIDTKQFIMCGIGPRQMPDPVFDETNRIVGGTEAQRGSWPFIVSLMKNGRHTCGGTLISQSHVLTAAHCVAKLTSADVAGMSVVIQTHTVKPVDPWAIQSKVRRVTRHKGFNSRTLYNDIAILTLLSPVQFSAGVSPVCLPNLGDANQFANYEAAVIGWGASREGASVSPVLQQVKVKVQSNSQCASNYGGDAPGGIIDSMICAAYPGKDSCQGDSGGPLMVPIQGKWVQVGVVSWGIGCGKPPYPGVYTRVTSFAQWIQANLQ